MGNAAITERLMEIARQADTLGQVLHRQRAVALQGGQDTAVGVVKSSQGRILHEIALCPV